MSIADMSGSAKAIGEAHSLADAGIPIFIGRLTRDGNPDKLDRRWKNWQIAEPGDASHAAIDAWKPGLALCAVTGIVVDVIDIDPRNGGKFALKRFNNDLGDNGPETYWTVKTPSGGWHLYIAPLGIGGRNGVLPGMDIKSGQPDGSGRGFVYLPPTIRPSKETGEPQPYVATEEWRAPVRGDSTGQAMITWLETLGAQRGASRGGRAPVSELKAAVLEAKAGGQREALLRYVHELERKGIDREDILDLLRVLCKRMQVYSAGDPWYPAKGGNPDSHLLGLLHRGGEVIGDADEDEAAEIAGLGDGNRPANLFGFQPLSAAKRTVISWGWVGYVPLNHLTILDGEKGNAKSLIVHDIASRLSRGDVLPDGSRNPFGEPVKTILFGEEDDEGQLRGRAEAAGADLDMILFRTIADLRKGKRIRRGAAPVGEEFALPGGAANIGKVLAASGARLAVFDPITDFLDAETQMHNDASVRRALRPLALELARIGVAGIGIRHMNKNTTADARHRGAGSTAFQNRARVHLAVGRMPKDWDGEGDHGLAVIDANMTKKPEGVLLYSIVDSDIPADDDGNMVPMLEWHGIASGVTANDMLKVIEGGRGPGRPSMVIEELVGALNALFDRRSVWPAKAVVAELEAMDVKATTAALTRARKELGIAARPIRRRGQAGVTGWEWYREGGDGNGGVRSGIRGELSRH